MRFRTSTTAWLFVFTTTTTTITNAETPSSNGNPILDAVGFCRDSFVRTYHGCVQLYDNHKRCNAIRTKRRNHEGHGSGIEYEEYDFLVRGREDRGKLTSLAFMSFFNPNFLPYAFLFFPNMLPSTLRFDTVDPTVSSDRADRRRAGLVLTAALELERSSDTPIKGNLLLPFLGRGKARQRRDRDRAFEVAAQRLLRGEEKNDETPNEESLVRRFALTKRPPSSESALLVDVPTPLLKGVARAIAADEVSVDGFFSSLTLRYQHRTKVLAHIKRVSEADAFLLSENVDVGRLSNDLLRTACSDRLIRGNDPNDDRNRLRSYLREVRSVVLAPNDQDDDDDNRTPRQRRADERRGVRRADASGNTERRYYNENLAKFALLCRNAVDAARRETCASILPRLVLVADRPTPISIVAATPGPD